MKSTSLNLNRLIPFLILGCAYFLSHAALLAEMKLVVAAILAVVVLIAVFKIEDDQLIVLIILSLAAGSCFMYQVASQSFYLRFYLLFLVTLKALMMSKKSSAQEGGARWTVFHSLFAYIALMGLVSSLYSIDSSLTFQRAISFVLLFFVLGGYFWYALKDMEDITSAVEAFWKTFGILMLLSIFFFFSSPSQMRHGGRLRLVFGNPNQLGHYCAMMAPILIWYFYEKAKTKWVAGFLIGIVPLCILGSGSRAAIIGTFLSCGLLFMICYRKQAVYLVATCLFLLAVHSLLRLDVQKPDVGPGYIKETVFRDYSIQTGSGRVGVWKSAWLLIKKKPFFGYGFGVTDRLFQLKFFPDLPLEFQGGHTHNSYLEELLNLGFIGSTGFFLLIAYFLLSGTRHILSMRGHGQKIDPIQVAVFCSIIAGVISSIFESWFSSVGSFFCFPFWFLGMLLIKMDHIRR